MTSRMISDDPSPLLAALSTATCPHERELLEEAVIESAQGLVAGTVRRFADRGIDREDLTAVAHLALLKAIRGFEPSRGDFFAYASATMSGELKKHFRDAGWIVRPPRAVQELQTVVTRTGEELSRDGIEPTDDALAEAAGATLAQVREARAARGCFAPTSLDSSSPGGRTLAETLAEEQPEFELVEGWASLRPLWRTLSDDDRLLLRLRFIDELSQDAIAPHLGISQMQVSRRLSALLKRLRAAVGAVPEDLAA